MEIKSLSYLPSVNSTDAQWIEWHKLLKSDVGKKNANILFLKAWEQRKNEGMLGSKANTSSLRDYLSSQGLEVNPDGLFAYPIMAVEEIENSIDSALGIGKWAFLILALLILIPAFILMMNVAKNPKILVDGAKAFV